MAGYCHGVLVKYYPVVLVSQCFCKMLPGWAGSLGTRPFALCEQNKQSGFETTWLTCWLFVSDVYFLFESHTCSPLSDSRRHSYMCVFMSV